MFTDMGDVFRTSDGMNFTLVSNTGFNDGIELVFVNDTLGYMLTSSGDILRTIDNGENWEMVSSISADDAVDMICEGANFYVLTRSGELYSGNHVGSLSLISSINGNDFVSLTHSENFLFAMTVSGDIWRSSDTHSWLLVGSTGSTEMVSIIAVGDTILAVNRYGDLFISTDNGETWVMTETVSQDGVVDLHLSHDGMVFLGFNTGELMKRNNGGWQYLGSASQVGVTGISTSGPLTLISDTSGTRPSNFLKVEPSITMGILRISSGKGEVCIYSMDGRIMRRIKKTTGEIEVDIHELSSGIYFVKMEDEVVRIIKF